MTREVFQQVLRFASRATPLSESYYDPRERHDAGAFDPEEISSPPTRVAVTGGTSGLGLALVDLLASRGDRVAFVARGEARVREVQESRPGAHGIVGDVALKEDMHPIAMRITAALGGLDVLVNNAGSLGPVPLSLLADTECESFEEAMATNLIGPFRLTKVLMGALAASARAGRAALVVNVISDAATEAYPEWGAYGTSKAALLQMSRIWDEEMRPHGVRVLAFDPGEMDTPLHEAALPGTDRSVLKRPAEAARELLTFIEEATRSETRLHETYEESDASTRQTAAPASR